MKRPRPPEVAPPRLRGGRALFLGAYLLAGTGFLVWMTREMFFKRTLEETVALRRAEDQRMVEQSRALWGASRAEAGGGRSGGAAAK